MVVRGMVQGVGFRWHARRVALQLNLRGYVRNQRDRSVEVMAEGPEDALRQLASYLKEGPSPASVESIDIEWLPYGGTFGSFEVRF